MRHATASITARTRPSVITPAQPGPRIGQARHAARAEQVGGLGQVEAIVLAGSRRVGS